MGTTRRGAVAAAAALALAASGCGGSDEGSRSDGGDQPSGAPVEGSKGGKVTFLAAADVDYMDPGQSYYTFGYTVQYAVNRPLYSFEPDDADTPVPDLAEGDPEISSDNKTITVKLRRGVKFAPPVDREVTADDVNYSLIDEAEIDDAMTNASVIPAGPERSKAWAEINEMVVAQAPGIPYSWDDSFQLVSKDVHGVMNGYTTTWDLAYSFLE